MKIKIKQENYKQLVQCIYLGNLIINEYRKEGEVKREYSDFVEDVLLQVVKSTPKPQMKIIFKNIPNEKTEDALLSDLTDRIEDSVREYHAEYRRSLLCEILDEITKANNIL